MLSDKCYWFGNAAKAQIIGEIIEAAQGQPRTVFDYGCGSAGHWPEILPQAPNLTLVGYDPYPPSLAKAKQRCAGLPATFYEPGELGRVNVQADYIVSFSVFEHVRDHRHYLSEAKKRLAPHGTFYLNYDDGHFRRYDMGEGIRHALSEVVRAVHLLSRKVTQYDRRTSNFMRRVNRDATDRLVRDLGYRVEREFYSNLSCLKDLSKTIPPEQHDAYWSVWFNTERALNEQFRRDVDEKYQDRANLWRSMASRTLVLRHA